MTVARPLPRVSAALLARLLTRVVVVRFGPQPYGVGVLIARGLARVTRVRLVTGSTWRVYAATPAGQALAHERAQAARDALVVAVVAEAFAAATEAAAVAAVEARARARRTRVVAAWALDRHAPTLRSLP